LLTGGTFPDCNITTVYCAQRAQRANKMGGVVQRTSPSSFLETSQKDMEIFFEKKSRILSSKLFGRTHPQLVLLRMILKCDYGRPKLIQYLMRTTSINEFFIHQDHFESNFFISKFDISSITPPPTLLEHLSTESSQLQPQLQSPSELDLESSLPQIILVTILSTYHNFLTSPEHKEWLTYQHMMKETKSHSIQSFHTESMRSISMFSSHRLVYEIRKLNFIQLLNKPDWIVAIAHLLETLPFPISILAKDLHINHSSLSLHTFSRSMSLNYSPTPSPVDPSPHQFQPSPTLFYANSSFVKLVGYNRIQIAQHSYEKYFSPSSSSSDHHQIPISSLSPHPSITQAQTQSSFTSWNNVLSSSSSPFILESSILSASF
jgi:hypothetical protein